MLRGMNAPAQVVSPLLRLLIFPHTAYSKSSQYVSTSSSKTSDKNRHVLKKQSTCQRSYLPVV